MSVSSERTISAAARPVVSPAVSYDGATSTVIQISCIGNPIRSHKVHLPTSAPTTSMPASPSKMVRSSLVIQPPTSGVPVASSCQPSSNNHVYKLRPLTRGVSRIEHIDVDADIHSRARRTLS